jgi:hypothetical protein
MKQYKVISSNISSIDTKDGIMYVNYKRGGRYACPEPKPEDMQKLLKAESVGKHLNSMGLKLKPVKEEGR